MIEQKMKIWQTQIVLGHQQKELFEESTPSTSQHI